jgi:O-glycosyl hydrolase
MFILEDSLCPNRQYFDPNGIGYSIARIPMAGTDFSLRSYTYADSAGDVNLTTFALQKEDYDYKVS